MPDFASAAENKVALRSQLLTVRKYLPDAVRRSASASVQASTLALVRRRRPTLCAAYVPLGSEPGGSALPALLADALPPGGRLILPILLPTNDLDWAVYGPREARLRLDRVDHHAPPAAHLDGDDLIDGPHGLRQPTGVPLGVDVVSQASLIIVPALAVSRSGMRLGRGGGSYDRVLTQATSAFTVALLHDGEFLDEVPAEPHDRPVDAVVTPTGGFRPLDGAWSGRNKLR